jgi:hypothetical protein
MIVSWWEPDRLPQASSTAERILGALHCAAHQLCADTTETASEKDSGGRRNAATGSGRNGFRIRMRTVTRTHIAPTSSRPGHTGVSPKCTHNRRLKPSGDAPLSSELRHYTAYPVSSGSHLGSTLRSGRAVLTRGVSRRSGSVAYIRADASPTEVLANPSWHRNRCSSNILAKNLASAPTVGADQSSQPGSPLSA